MREYPFPAMDQVGSNFAAIKAGKIRPGISGSAIACTARRYIVGYLVKKLREAEALSPDVIVANGIEYHPEPASAGH